MAETREVKTISKRKGIAHHQLKRVCAYIRVSTASSDQATGIAQINTGIEQVAQVVQQNSATSEESAAASEELSSQAELLKETIHQFSLRQ